jgi:putative oxidoreductase
MMHNVDALLVLAARAFLAALFLIFGLRKVRDWSGTVSQMVEDRLPMPVAAAAIAILMEVPVAFAIAIGAFTRPLALLMFCYTLGTSLAEHRFWMTAGPQRIEKMEAFFKNLSIMGGFLLLFVTGPGRYSIDAWFGFVAP